VDRLRVRGRTVLDDCLVADADIDFLEGEQEAGRLRASRCRREIDELRAFLRIEGHPLVRQRDEHRRAPQVPLHPEKPGARRGVDGLRQEGQRIRRLFLDRIKEELHQAGWRRGEQFGVARLPERGGAPVLPRSSVETGDPIDRQPGAHQPDESLGIEPDVMFTKARLRGFADEAQDAADLPPTESGLAMKGCHDVPDAAHGDQSNRLGRRFERVEDQPNALLSVFVLIEGLVFGRFELLRQTNGHGHATSGESIELRHRDSARLPPLDGALVEDDAFEFNAADRMEHCQIEMIVRVVVRMEEIRRVEDGLARLGTQSEQTQGGQGQATQNGPGSDHERLE